MSVLRSMYILPTLSSILKAFKSRNWLAREERVNARIWLNIKYGERDGES